VRYVLRTSSPGNESPSFYGDDSILRQTLRPIEFSRAISRVSVRLKANASEISSVFIITVDVRNDQNSPAFISLSLVDALYLTGATSLCLLSFLLFLTTPSNIIKIVSVTGL
jgi:hypothetical protein